MATTKKKTAARKTARKPAKKTAVKKTTAMKTTAVKKTGTKKGSSYACGVCGLAVTVDRTCGCVDTCDIICCGRQMKKK